MLGDEFEHFLSLGSFEKASFVSCGRVCVVLCLTHSYIIIRCVGVKL